MKPAAAPSSSSPRQSRPRTTSLPRAPSAIRRSKR